MVPSALITTVALFIQRQHPMMGSIFEFGLLLIDGTTATGGLTPGRGLSGFTEIGGETTAWPEPGDRPRKYHPAAASTTSATPIAGRSHLGFAPAPVPEIPLGFACSLPAGAVGASIGGIAFRDPSGSSVRMVVARLSRWASSGGVIASSQCTELM